MEQPQGISKEGSCRQFSLTPAQCSGRYSEDTPTPTPHTPAVPPRLAPTARTAVLPWLFQELLLLLLHPVLERQSPPLRQSLSQSHTRGPGAQSTAWACCRWPTRQ